jgi:hypothetical protein
MYFCASLDDAWYGDGKLKTRWREESEKTLRAVACEICESGVIAQ